MPVPQAEAAQAEREAELSAELLPESDTGASRRWMIRAEARAMPATEELLGLARAAAPDPTAFDEFAPLFVRSGISNSKVDAYFTRMCPKPDCTLANYAAEAQQGRAVLLGHDNSGVPLGLSLTGVGTGAQGNGVARVQSDYYVVPDPDVPGAVGAVRAVRRGNLRENSVGFYGGHRDCGLCSKPYWSYDCPHMAGLSYIRDDNGDWHIDRSNSEEAQTAYVWVHDAHLAEFSLVYKGATPDAAVVAIKAAQAQDAGQLDVGALLQLRQRFDWQPAVGGLVVPASGSATLSTSKEDRMPPKPDAEARELTAEERTALTAAATAPIQAQLDAAAATLAGVRSALGLAADADPVPALGTLAARVKELEPLAADGRSYREQVVKDAVAEGVRALGPEKFDAEARTTQLSAMPTELVAQMRDQWREIGDARLKPGRATTNGAASRQQEAGGGKRPIPVSAFTGR